MADVLYILSSAMSLLRRCRVNAALTIQLFSQLFHYINMWLFNKLVLEPQLGLCTRAWGRRLRRRLSYVEAWAEKQGLELAADCHLCRIVQVRWTFNCVMILRMESPGLIVYVQCVEHWKFWRGSLALAVTAVVVFSSGVHIGQYHAGLTSSVEHVPVYILIFNLICSIF